MTYRTGNYSAFYVAEPFSASALGANATPDFMYYNLLRAWKAADHTFPFTDSHDKTYNVRDSSDWETTLKPRLHQRLNMSKNIILFLSSNTKSSRALREEIDYGVNKLGLPIIVIYPQYEQKSDIIDPRGYFQRSIVRLWDNLPVFRDNKDSVPVLHIPLEKKCISQALSNKNFQVQSMIKPGDYV